jgi:hypothetical protein
MTTLYSSSRLLVVACLATKRGDTKYIPAIDRHKKAALANFTVCGSPCGKGETALLSARLGFRSADPPIKMYDARMTVEIAAAMKAGGLRTLWPH